MNDEKFAVEICKDMREIFDVIRANVFKSSSETIEISYFEASKILSKKIIKAGGINEFIRFV